MTLLARKVANDALMASAASLLLRTIPKVFIARYLPLPVAEKTFAYSQVHLTFHTLLSVTCTMITNSIESFLQRRQGQREAGRVMLTKHTTGHIRAPTTAILRLV